MSDSIEDFPEAAQKMIRALRTEAAEARVAKRSAVEDAEKALETKLKAEFDAKLSALDSKTVDLESRNSDLLRDALRIEAALSVGVAAEQIPEFAKRLQGSSKDEIFADAANAKSLFGVATPVTKPPAVDPSQGLGGSAGEKSPADMFGDFITRQLDKR